MTFKKFMIKQHRKFYLTIMQGQNNMYIATTLKALHTNLNLLNIGPQNTTNTDS
jgi:hypothetical protein